MSSPLSSHPSPETPPEFQGRRSKRVTTQAATAASTERATLRYTASPPSSGSVRRTSRSKALAGESPEGKTDIEHQDANALRFAGYRGAQFFEGLDRDCAGGRMEICVCAKVARGASAGDDVDVEELVRCSVRDCEPGWFHLVCVGLPDHPPVRFGWMCPGCILTHGITTSVEGLWDFKRGEDVSRAKQWLKEMRREVEELQQQAAGGGVSEG